MKKIFIFLALIIFSGCATLSSPELDETIAKRLIRSSGTAENVETNFFTGQKKVVNNKKSFTLDESQVTWWAKVWDSNMLPLRLHAKWFDAQGNLYKEYDFFALGNIDGIISIALPIKNYIFTSQQGEWKVVVSFRGNEIDSQYFYIGKMGEETERKISEEKLKEIFPNLDKANALILLNEVNIEVDKNYKTKKIIKRRIKIISDRGKQLYSVVNIPFYSTLESVEVNMAHTIKPDGEIAEAKDMQMFSPFEDYPNYRASRVLGIAMPSVEKGSIVEYEIESESSVTQTLPSFWDEFYFNRIDPVLVSKYVVVCPEDFDLKVSKFNVDLEPDITIDETKKTKTYIWQKNNWQAVELEKYMPSARETAATINIYTTSSWQDVAAWWNRLSRDRLMVDSQIVNKAKELTEGKTNKLEKIKAIFSFVQSEIRYIQVAFGASPYEPISAIETFKNKYGDCKDQATLLIAMLKAIGIDDVYYGLIRTKDEGPVNKLSASPREFNHVIAFVRVDDKELFLDPTARNLRFGIAPFSLQGTDVFVIKVTDGDFIYIPVAGPDINQIESFITLNINDNLEIDGKLRVVYTGQIEWYVRTYLESFQPKQRDEYMHSILTNVYPGAVLKDYFVKHEGNLDENLEVEINFSLLGWIEKVGDVYLLKFTVDNVAAPPEYLSLKRKFPVKELYKIMTKATIELILASKFAIKDLPQDFSIESNYLSGSVIYKKHDNKIIREQIIKTLLIDIPTQDISKCKETYDEIFKAHKQGIVLVAQ